MMKKKSDANITALKQSIKPLISVCIIAKDEEKYIDRCLRSVKPIADEIIFVDTGSTDRTVKIARKYTDKIYFHPWNNSFSEARNYYLKYATGDWIFQIDADEELVKEDITSILKAIQDKSLDAVVIQIISTKSRGRSKAAVHNSERLFRNNGIIRYEGRVHNRVVGVTSSKIYPVRLLHYGYDILEGDVGKKFDRTVSLLVKDLEDNPDNPATHHYLSSSYLSRDMYQETIEHGLKAIHLAEAQGNRDMMFLWTHYNLSLAYYKLNNLKAARDMAIHALEKYPDHIDSHFMMIVLSFDEKRWTDLIYHADRYLQLLDILDAEPSKFGNLVTCSLNEEWNMHVLLGIAHAELGQEANSQKSFNNAIQSALEPFIALRAIGIYFYNKNNRDKSFAYLEKARKLNANDETVNQLLGKMSAKNEKIQKEPTISCCMIVKNEEAFLEACLVSVKNFVDEIIIVDTGSTDNTVDIARRFTDRIYFHPWEGSFSTARNQALQYAGCDWILQIDGDEELVEGSGVRLRQTVREAGEADAILLNIISVYSGGRKTARHNFERLFRNNGVIHYESIVHNRVVGQTCTKPSKIELMHYGYNVEEKKSNEKFVRTVDLLKRQIRETPDDPMPHHYLGTSYLSKGMHKECVEESTLAIRLAERQGNKDSIYLSTHHNAAFAFFHLGEYKNTRDYSLRALKKFPDHLDSLFMMTMLSAEDKQWNDLLRYGLRFLELREESENNPERTGAILNATLREGSNVNLLVGHAYHALKNDASMDRHYQGAYRMSEDKWQCWWNIGTFHMDRSGDLRLSRHYLDLALTESPDEPSVWYMLAKWNSKKENDKDEKQCLAKLFELGSQDVLVLNRLAALCLSSDDLATAQQALDTLMKIDHQNFAALCNLGLLYRRQNALDRAMEAFSKAIEINPQESAPWLHLGEIAVQLGQLDNARLFFERVCNLRKGLSKALLYLCEIELRQDRMVECIHWCDMLLKELQLNRDRTLRNVEDLSGILHEIHSALIQDSELSSQVSKILSLLSSSKHQPDIS
jgi:glycosyltransferase involved in cell wall biosynthesis/cytochrome c-type biogenesis protein CcmH/NrfG